MARLIDADKLIDDIEHSWDMDSVNGITAETVIKQIKQTLKTHQQSRQCLIVRLQRQSSRSGVSIQDLTIFPEKRSLRYCGGD